MDTIVKVLNEKVTDGDAKTIVEALKQIDPNAEGETVAEVLKNMELGGGGGGSSITPILTLTMASNSAQYHAKNVISNGNVYSEKLVRAEENADVLIIADTSGPTPFFGYLVGNKNEQVTYEVTNLVNGTLVDNEQMVGILITDPSKNASATLYYNQTLD